MIERKNKKGWVMPMVFFFLILFVMLFLGFMMVVGSSLLNWTMDVIVPEVSNLGSVGSTNFTEIATFTITPLNSIIQSFTWLTGVLYFMMIVASLGIALMFRNSPSKWLIAFWLMLTLILVIGSIFMSNIYEDFSTGNDDLATRMQEHVLLHFMILYSPMIFTIIAFISGIILFSGMQESFL